MRRYVKYQIRLWFWPLYNVSDIGFSKLTTYKYSLESCSEMRSLNHCLPIPHLLLLQHHNFTAIISVEGELQTEVHQGCTGVNRTPVNLV